MIRVLFICHGYMLRSIPARGIVNIESRKMMIDTQIRIRL